MFTSPLGFISNLPTVKESTQRKRRSQRWSGAVKISACEECIPHISGNLFYHFQIWEKEQIVP